MSNAALLWVAAPMLVAGAGTLVVGWVRRRQALVLAATVLVAVGVLVGVSGWLLAADATAGTGDALRTGGLAAAAVVALYGLWLNDRRRQVEEGRQRTETDRHQLETRRIGHERFARAVELLGSDADQVRVGAMHALAGLAKDTPDYTQTVLDVLCAYLRRPFYHPSYRTAHDPNRTKPDEFIADPDKDREQQVRLTAMRLIRGLLPAADEPGPGYDLDLSGATVEYFSLAHKKTGRILARRAKFYGITTMAGLVTTDSAMFSAANFYGRVDLSGARLLNGTAFVAVTFARLADLTGATFRDWVDFRYEEPADLVLDGTTVDVERSMLPDSLVIGPDNVLSRL